MKARVRWIEDLNFVGQSGSGHAVVLGASQGTERPAQGASPMELVLIGLGGCSAIDVVLILKKGREAVSDCIVELEAERAATEPKVFTQIHLRFTVTGSDLNPAKVERAVALSAEKYCSVSAMLDKTAKITHDVEIVDQPGP
jgi:putative redox protein